jgi:hypothetical protein
LFGRTPYGLGRCGCSRRVSSPASAPSIAARIAPDTGSRPRLHSEMRDNRTFGPGRRPRLVGIVVSACEASEGADRGRSRGAISGR